MATFEDNFIVGNGWRAFWMVNDNTQKIMSLTIANDMNIPIICWAIFNGVNFGETVAAHDSFTRNFGNLSYTVEPIPDKPGQTYRKIDRLEAYGYQGG